MELNETQPWEGGEWSGHEGTGQKRHAEEEENGCGHEQCGLGKTDDGKQHQTGGQSRSEKREDGQEENGIHKDWRTERPWEEQEQQQEQKIAVVKQQQPKCPLDHGPERLGEA